MAKNKLNLLQIILLCVAAVGVILAIVGIAVPWYTGKLETLLGGTSESYGLFAEYAKETDISIALVQAFAIITLIFTVAACLVMALNSLGVVKIKWLIRVICAAVVIVFAVLTLIFAIVYGNQFSTAGVLSTELAASAGAYLLPIGSIITAVPLFLGKE